MDDLVSFLRKRLDEDEETARLALRVSRRERLASWLRRLGRRWKA